MVIATKNIAKKGVQCPRNCGIVEDGHKRVREIPGQFGQNCNKSSSNFKHNSNNSAGFQGHKQDRGNS